MMYNLMIFHGFDTQIFMKNKSCDGLYSDLKKDHYAAQAICLGYYIGWFKDFVNIKEFKPDEPIKRHEIAQIIANIITNESFRKYVIIELIKEIPDLKTYYDAGYNFGLTDKAIYDGMAYAATSEFDDVFSRTPNVSAIGFVYYLNIMKGNNGFFNPLHQLNRAEIAHIIVNMSAYFKNYN